MRGLNQRIGTKGLHLALAMCGAIVFVVAAEAKSVS